MEKKMAKMKMVSMMRTASDKRGDKMSNAPIEATQPDYPYGLVLHLEKDEIDKLGMKQLPGIGTEMPMHVLLRVTRVSQSAAEGADEQTSVDLQITDIGIGAAEE